MLEFLKCENLGLWCLDRNTKCTLLQCISCKLGNKTGSGVGSGSSPPGNFSFCDTNF